MKSTLAKFLLLAVGCLPLRLARWLGSMVGWLAWRRNSRETMVARTNLQFAFPALSDTEREQLVKASMCDWGKTLFEVPVVWNRSLEWLEKHTLTITNEAIFQQALKSGKGIILVAPHLGNWEVLRFLIRHRAMTALYQPPRDAGLEALVRAARSKGGTKLVPTDRRGVMALIKALRKGEMTVILPDQEPDPSGGIFVPLYGVPALTMTLVPNLLNRSESEAVMVVARRVAGGFELIFQQPDQQIYAEDEVVAVAALNRSVETLVQQAPSQYQWEYKRYKKRPPGEAKIYP